MKAERRRLVSGVWKRVFSEREPQRVSKKSAVRGRVR
jgi:hypothetical protein